MDFLHFGSPERRLFACRHDPVGTGPASGMAILLCPPWGQEAVRTQRMFRVLAERLSRAGARVLRFDYFGTGDALGDDLDVTVSGCRADVASASAQLLEAGPAERLVWVGVRLGASVALQAVDAPGLARRPDHLIAWEPVVDGAAYLAELRERHADALESAYTIPDARLRGAMARDPALYQDEAMGFAMSGTLRAELAALRLGDETGRSLPRLTVLGRDDRPLPGWSATPPGAGGERHFQVLAHEFDWTSEEALNTALVPGVAVQTIFALCCGH